MGVVHTIKFTGNTSCASTRKRALKLIIDDHTLMRTILRMFLERQTDLMVVDEGVSLDKALAPRPVSTRASS